MNQHPPILLLDLIAKIFFFLSGWKVSGSLPEEKKYVAIFAPHTSNWDFIVVIACKFLLRIRARWYAKDSVFFWPQGILLRQFGGIPIERSKSHNVVQTAIAAFAHHEYFILGLAPEGTRTKVEKFRSGFYHIAKGANVPILPVGLDYKLKTVFLLPLIHTTDNMEEDMEKVYAAFRPINARIPTLKCER